MDRVPYGWLMALSVAVTGVVAWMKADPLRWLLQAAGLPLWAALLLDFASSFVIGWSVGRALAHEGIRRRKAGRP